MKTIGAQLMSSGLGFTYRNHGFEFIVPNGQIGYDIILKEIGPHAERYVMWHIKGMDNVTRDYTEIGQGSIEYVIMLSNIDTKVLEYFYLEQDGNFAYNSVQSIVNSSIYFKKSTKTPLMIRLFQT